MHTKCIKVTFKNLFEEKSIIEHKTKLEGRKTSFSLTENIMWKQKINGQIENINNQKTNSLEKQYSYFVIFSNNIYMLK